MKLQSIAVHRKLHSHTWNCIVLRVLCW